MPVGKPTPKPLACIFFWMLVISSGVKGIGPWVLVTVAKAVVAGPAFVLRAGSINLFGMLLAVLFKAF